jgi:hypothetical protein
MKKSFLIGMVLFCLLTSFTIHKFYVAIYQINYASDKKMLQITSRIFIDDINTALKTKYQKDTHLGEKEESQEDILLLNKYFLENFSMKINGQTKPLHYISKEMENNVLICYFNIKDINKITTLEIQNTILTDVFSDQQNIIQATINGKKSSLLLSGETTKGVLK